MMLPFALANWRWALPSAIAALAVGWALVERAGHHGCKAARAEEQVAAQKALLEQKDKDRALADRIITDQAATIASLAAKTSTHTEVIRHVPVTTACRDTPAMRAADDGLRALGFARGERDQARPAAAGDAGAPGDAGPRP